MKIILRIAKAELRHLFYSPVAWFLTIAFFVQCALIYTKSIGVLANWQEALLGTDQQFSGFRQSLTEILFAGKNGIYPAVIGNLYLFIPLLTMGIVSREISNGTFKLLSSSPIKTRDIVFGKYLAILAFNLIFIASLMIFIALGNFSIVSLDWGFILSGILGIYLLVAAYTAIGLFMSSLTMYQIVSAVSFFLTISFLNRIGGLWQQYDFVRDITYILSMYGRTSYLIKGLISSKDVIYFILIIGMFITFTLIKIRSTRESKPWYVNASRYLGVALLVILVGYVSHRPSLTLYWDITRDQVNTIHPNTQEIIRNFEKGEPLKVTLYSNLLGLGFEKTQPKARSIYQHAIWQQYVRFKPDIEFDFVYYYDIPPGDSSLFQRFPDKDVHEIAKIQAKGHQIPLSKFLSPDEVRKKIDLGNESHRAFMLLEYKGKKTILRTFDDAYFWPNEMNYSAAFLRLQQEKMPKVIYTSGNLERNIFKTGEREYSTQATNIRQRYSMSNIGFDADTINLDQDEIPKNISFLVVADPKSELSSEKQLKLKSYLDHGGNAFFLGEPGKQDILNDVLKETGIQLGAGTLVQITEDEMPHVMTTSFTREGLEMTEENKYILKAIDNNIFVRIPSGRFVGVAPVLFDEKNEYFSRNFSIFSTEEKSNTFCRIGKLVVDSIAPAFEPELGDYKHPSFSVIRGFTRQVNSKEQRIIVSGDADYFSNLRLYNDAMQYNVEIINWLDNNRLPVFSPKDIPQDQILKSKPTAIQIHYYLFVWIVPGLLILLGSIILIRRKRK